MWRTETRGRAVGFPVAWKGSFVPQFYFHVRSGDHLARDPEGVDLPDLDAVRLEAREGAKEILQLKIHKDELVDGQRFEVTDEHGHVVLTYAFRDAIKLL